MRNFFFSFLAFLPFLSSAQCTEGMQVGDSFPVIYPILHSSFVNGDSFDIARFKVGDGELEYWLCDDTLFMTKCFYLSEKIEAVVLILRGENVVCIQKCCMTVTGNRSMDFVWWRIWQFHSREPCRTPAKEGSAE